MQRAHIVQPVGELDQQHPDVVRHGEQELAQILGRPLILCLRLDLRQLGDPVDEAADIAAEQPLDLLGRRQRVFQRSEEHTSELQSLMRISYAVFCLQKKTKQKQKHEKN